MTDSADRGPADNHRVAGAPLSTATVSTTTGTLRGRRCSDHDAFLRIRYARPPVGDLRFLPPLPAEPWVGVVDAMTPGSAAPQDPFVPAGFRATEVESEDCLFLNVYTPALDGARRPVLFWIHGGGFSHGSSTQRHYDGGPLAVRGDVVVVSANYRLGALGYLSLGAHGGAEWGAGTNVGQLDQIAALTWVRDNIAAFGGDPGNVTVFGQSAGSFAVAALLGMPAASGLFAKAIAQSGTANRLGTLDTAADVTSGFLGRLGLGPGDASAVRSTPVHDLLRAQGGRGALAPIVDHTTLPHPPLTSVRTGGAASIPLMIGTTRDEHKLYIPVGRADIDECEMERQVAAQLPRRAAHRADEVVEVYRLSRARRDLPTGHHDIVDAVATASRFRMPAIRLAEAQQAHQPRTFVYQFDFDSPARGGSLGACHGLEIPFVFGSIGRTGDDRMTGTGPDVDGLSGRMMDAWINFARYGDPSTDRSGHWPGYTTASRETMMFDRESGMVSAPFDEERTIWTSLLDTN